MWVAYRTMGRKILGFHDEYMSRACIIEDKGALFPFVIASSSSTMRILCTRKGLQGNPFKFQIPLRSVLIQSYHCSWYRGSPSVVDDFVGWTNK